MKAKNSSTIFQFRSSVLLLALLTAFSGAQATAAGGPSPGGRAQAQATLPAQSQAAPAQMAPQSASVCGSQPLCAETSDFAATITDFRTSTAGYYKLIDVVLRFQNKTSQPIILGYVDGSLEATDDQGNRYGMAGNGQGVRGLGIISGNNLDPKFVLQPGGAGDARFELAWRPANEIQGTTFELYLTIREATPVDARQYVLGGEFPFHCQGLANGVRAAISSTNASGAGLAGGAAPAGAGVTAAAGVASAVAGAAPGSAQPGCVPAGQGAQNAASTIANAASSVGGQNQKAAGAASQISSAASTISSLGSLFKSKKAATTSAQSTTGLPPCPPGSTGDASGVSTVASTVGGAVPQAAGGASSVAAVASSVTGASTPVAGVASPAAGAFAPGVAGGNPCAGRQHCYNAGPFTAEIQLAAGNQRASLALMLRNVTNQPILLAYKGTTSQLRDNLGHALLLQQDPSGYQRPSRLNPGQGMPLGFGFSAGQNPLGTSFTYGVVVDQVQVLQNGQVQVLREYPLNFPGLTLPGAAATAPATKPAASATPAATSGKAAAVKKPAATLVPKKP